MGLLDDAIREHLELKRRRGADPTEIERAEREALGPVRRTPEPLESDSLGPDEEPIGYDDEEGVYAEDEPEWDDERYAEDSEPLEHGDEPGPPPPRAAVPRGEPAGETPPPRGVRGDPDSMDQATAEYRIESEGESDDVLEETPEFLQDAPEHDRLWFEQRPPRDFDFNE